MTLPYDYDFDQHIGEYVSLLYAEAWVVGVIVSVKDNWLYLREDNHTGAWRLYKSGIEGIY